MSDKPIPSRQSQSKHKIYYFKTGVLAPAGRGAAPVNPYKEGTVRLRPYEDEEKEPMGKYLSADDQRLLIDYGFKTQSGVFGADAKNLYRDLVERLETSKDEAVDVKEILKLLGVLDLKGNDSDYNLRIALKEAFPESKDLVDEGFHMEGLITSTPTKSKKSTSSRMNDPPIDNTDVSPNEPILAKKTSLEQSIDKVRDIQKGLRDSAEKRTERERVSSERKASRSASRGKDSSRPTDPDKMGEIDETIYEYRDDPPRDLVKDFDSAVLSPDPTDSTKMMDSGGAVIDYRDESLGKKTKMPTQPDARNIDSNVASDLLTMAGKALNEHIGSNPYNIPEGEMKRQEERERLSDEKALDYYDHQQVLLDRNPPITQGGGNDVTGAGRGGQRDLDLLGSDFAPASYDVSNPQGMSQSMKRNVSQARDGSINITLSGMPLDDNNVRRDNRNAGLSDEGLTSEEILQREFMEAYMRGEAEGGGGRLADRVGQAMMDNANSLMSAGSGIYGQIGDLLDLSGDGFGQDSRGNGLFGVQGGVYNNDDVSAPRTLNERFSNLGMRRQGDKIDKYVNMKNKGMMYSNLMGKGVSDPSIQSIRDRKDDYIQPDRKHRGNAVNLIRQSNATSIRLNNMYMP
jgi:hypothetical protein